MGGGAFAPSPPASTPHALTPFPPSQFGLILGVVAINVTIGMVQEGKAEKAADALNNMLAPHCTVVRDGSRKALDADQLVVGDIVFVQSGDRIPADIRLLTCTDLQVLESMLTGESLAVTKTITPVAEKSGLGDRKCMCFSATLVQQGQGMGLVVATGDHTAIGSINALVQGEVEKPTSLQVQLELFGRTITACTIALGIAAFLLAFFYTKTSWSEAFRASVAIAVAIIPEGLPAVVTITMALGVNAMAKQNAIVRKLPAVETLGSVSTVCSDKTGTLTKNQMTAVAFVTGGPATGGAHYAVSGVGYDPTVGSILSADGTPVPPEVAARHRTLLRSAVLPNDGGLSKGASGTWEISGDPTDVAPLVLFTKAGGVHEAEQRAAEKLTVVPFESLHKWQAVMVKDASVPAGRVVHLKGAPERLLPLCGDVVTGEDVLAAPTTIDGAWWAAKASELSSKGLRVLAVARWAPPASFDASSLTVAYVSTQPKPFLTLVGLIAILDPPRDECIVAIREFHSAGIVVKMITGDHPKTAVAIGTALGLTTADGEVHTGPEVDEMSDEQLAAVVLTCNVYARASPENKIRIVKALQSHGQIVSMTGDGVNDAPSLKAANIGVAMGITGTDVSKEAAKIVLADDNFATIVLAVREGRRVWDNLRKVFLYNLPTNFAQGLVVFFSFVLGMKKSPLTPIQVLYVNMIISVSLGGAISFEVAEEGIMTRKPRASNKPLVGKHILFRTFWITSLMVVAIIGIFEWSLSLGYEVGQARAAAFTLLVTSSVFYGLNCRSVHEFALGRSILRPNKTFWFSVVFVMTLQAIIVHVDGINKFFSCEAEEINHLPRTQCVTMGGLEWGVIFGISIALFFLVELEKALSPLLWNPILKPLFARAFGSCGGCRKINPLHHSEGTEGDFRFLATSASFHGVATRVGSKRTVTVSDPSAESADKPAARFSSRSLRTKAVSSRLLATGASSGASDAVSVSVRAAISV